MLYGNNVKGPIPDFCLSGRGIIGFALQYICGKRLLSRVYLTTMMFLWS